MLTGLKQYWLRKTRDLCSTNGDTAAVQDCSFKRIEAWSLEGDKMKFNFHWQISGDHRATAGNRLRVTEPSTHAPQERDGGNSYRVRKWKPEPQRSVPKVMTTDMMRWVKLRMQQGDTKFWIEKYTRFRTRCENDTGRSLQKEILLRKFCDVPIRKKRDREATYYFSLENTIKSYRVVSKILLPSSKIPGVDKAAQIQKRLFLKSTMIWFNSQGSL